MIDSGKKLRFGVCFLTALALLGGCVTTGQPAPEIKLASAESRPKCPDPRPMVMVTAFDAGVQDVPQEVGLGLADMLVATMTETGCYRMIDQTVLIGTAGGSAAGGPADASAPRTEGQRTRSALTRSCSSKPSSTACRRRSVSAGVSNAALSLTRS